MKEISIDQLLTQLSSRVLHHEEPTDEVLRDILYAIRQHMGMDVAYVTEFSNGKRIFRCVDTTFSDCPVKVGGCAPNEETYCKRVVDGRLPEVIPETADCPVANQLPVTKELNIGSHIGVPIRLSDGRTYGTLCCFSKHPDSSLAQRDLALVRVFADLAGKYIGQDLFAQEKRQLIEERVRSVIEGNKLSIVYQPIYHVPHNCVVGFEALARFSCEPVRSPDLWCKEAAEVELGVELEIIAIKTALQGMEFLPEPLYISVNASPQTILSGKLDSAFSPFPLNRIVLEITEHALIDQYEDITRLVKPLRSKGIRLAVDDAGAGYSSFRHILHLEPDIIKLDMSITHNVDTDRARRALAAALVRFAEESDIKIVAEGVETASELATLRQLGVNKAQGYFVGRPMTIEEASSFRPCFP